MLTTLRTSSLGRAWLLLTALFCSAALAQMNVELPAGSSNEAADQNRQAAGWTLSTPSGESVDFPAAAQGRPSVLLFWPSWCPFSRALQPYVQDIWKDYRDRRVNVWTINILENGDPVQTMKDRGLSFPLLLEGDPLIPRYGIQRTPWLVVIDGANRIVYTRPANAPSPIHVARAVRRTLNQLIGDQAVPMPEQFPKPYDLHLRGSSGPRSSDVEQQTTRTAEAAGDWKGWAHGYLTNFNTGPAVDGLAPIDLDDKENSLLDQSRQRWRQQYGEDALANYRGFRAYRLNNLWVTASVADNAAQGQGLLLVFEAESGRILHIARGGE